MCNREWIAAIVCLVSLLWAIQTADAASRTALVIGNSNYKAAAPLKNPGNDARDMAEALKDIGFEVICKVDAGREEMDAAVQDFFRNLNRAQAGFFYYAGHGMQINGVNYLLPIDIHVSSAGDVKHRAIKTDWILSKMEDSGSKVNVVVLDACRDNPFRGLRGAGDGLAPIQSVRGSFIAYATSPGSVARDGTGRNGIYTSHLLKNIKRSGLTVEEVFREVRKGVAESTNYEQVPWDSSSLMGAFYLASKGTNSGSVKADKVVLPSEGGASFDDILKARTDRQQAIERWSAWQSAREREYSQVQEIDSDTFLKPEEKRTAWERFLSAVSDDNPFSTKDEELRAKAEERARYWKGYKVASVPSRPKKPVSSPSGSNEIDRDGVYVAYANGTVRDTSTGLEWKAGPDRDTDWNEARSWVQSLGGDWRMPTMDELERLYQKGKGDRNMTPLLKTNGWWVWSGETDEGSVYAKIFLFSRGTRDRSPLLYDAHTLRAFAVRSRSDG